jgi:beta-phosphoglucomutase-like phosphatase (HAD superfamily)
MSSSSYPFQISSTSCVLPEKPFKGLIFDCDGTLVDSMPLHLKAWREALTLNGFPAEQFTLEMHHRFAGMPGVAIVTHLNEKFGASLDAAKVEADKVAWYLSHHDEVTEVKPVVDFARSHFGKIPMAVASGSDRKIVELSLSSLGLTELFDHIVTPEMVQRGKPAPDMFLLAAKLIGIEATDCLVFEDGHLGMQAAESAGMSAVWVLSE